MPEPSDFHRIVIFNNRSIASLTVVESYSERNRNVNTSGQLTLVEDLHID